MVLLFALATSFGFMYLMNLNQETPGVSKTTIFSMLFTAGVVMLIYLNNKKFSRLAAENLRIWIDDESITREINLDNVPGMNFFHKMSYNKAKRRSDGYFLRISFKDVQSIEKVKGGILVKAKGASSINGKGIIVIPDELSNFEDLEFEIKRRTN